MTRNIVGAAVLGVAMLGALGQAKACEACARLHQQTEGKLIKEGKVPAEFRWVLKTADKSYSLKMGSRTLTRLAAALEGEDVIVTGARDGDKIEARDLAAKERHYTGVLDCHMPDIYTLPGMEPLVYWSLNNPKSSGLPCWNLTFASKPLAEQAEKLVGKPVCVKARRTIRGLVVSAIEAAK